MRLEITRRAELAVRALLHLTLSGERATAPALAEALGTTAAFVPQIISPLVRAGWVSSDPGPTGGYRALVGPEDVSVLQVIEAVEGPTDTGRCSAVDRGCDPDRPCLVHVAWTRARSELTRTLAATTLLDTVSGTPV